MDIHKPKPWHGVREFLKEYAIIVVGVLTALGAEQVVEWAHWQHVVASARESLKPDFVRIMRIVGRKDADTPCLASRMNEIQDILNAAQASGRLPAIGPVPSLNDDPWKVRNWDGMVSSQAPSHMKQNEALSTAAIVGTGDYLGIVRDQAIAHWSVLATLNGPARTITPQELATYRTAIAQTGQQISILRTISHSLARNVLKTGILTRAEAEKAWREGGDQGRAEALCQPISREPGYLSSALPALAEPTKLPF